MDWSPTKYQAQWHNLQILDFVIGAQQAAQHFWQMNNWAPQDPAQWHKLHILDFISGAQEAGTQAQHFLANKQLGSPRSGTLAQFTYTGTAILTKEQRSQHRPGTLQLKRYSGCWQWGIWASKWAQPCQQIKKQFQHIRHSATK